MPRYKRYSKPGGTYFFTVVLANRDERVLVEHFSMLAAVLRQVKHEKPFRMNAWVILPDHIHCLWTLPEHDSDFASRWWTIKSLFTKRYRQHTFRNTGKVWQNRYWEHLVRNQNDFDRHLDYIHFNPVKHGYVTSAWDWPYSSFRHYVDRGFYTKCWGNHESTLCNIGMGE